MGLCCLIAAPRTLHCWIEGQGQELRSRARAKVKGSVLFEGTLSPVVVGVAT